MAMSVSRRHFARLLALGGSGALLSERALAGAQAPAPARGGPAAGDAFWKSVREQFMMPPDLAVLNAANLCPASRPALDALARETANVDRDPSPHNRARLYPEKENTRTALARFLRVSPDEIIITRNTSESNNLVSNGLDLKAGDEVIVHSDNHPSNLNAWHEKGKRFGFSVVTVEQKNPHPGAEYYLDAFARAMTARTRALCFTHLSSTVGDLMPARELCRIAREKGVLTLVDGAQSFGLLDVNLAEMQPDFYSGSAHKWPCGARECGVLFVSKAAQNKVWPTIYSAYPGAVGFSRTFEGFGQRDEATMIAFREALAFQDAIGREAIARRSCELATQLIAGLAKLPGVKVWTSPVPDRRAAVVSFLPGSLDASKLASALYENDRIAVATRGGTDRGGVRVSPHLYNSPAEIERLLASVRKYLNSGV